MSGHHENDYFDDQNLAFLPAAHPLMTKLQDALKKTLEVNHEKVHLKLKEKEGKLKKLEREREDTAVRLYEVQQSLADLHITLEQTHQNFNLVEKLRVDAEKKLTILNQEHENKKKQVERLDKNVIKAQDDLSKITRSLLELEEYNKHMRSEIAVTRRTTYRVEENILQEEQVKKKQDYILDNLTEQKKKFSEQITIIEAQLLAQRDETKSAKDILKEAFVEMENIIASKKQLLDRWQRSLLEMQRRDKALQVAREALKNQYESSVAITAEIAGVNNEVKKEAAASEVFGASLNRLRLEERHLDEERLKLDHEIEKLNAQIKILQQSLQITEQSAQVVEKDNKKIEDQMKIIEENIMKIHTQATKIFEQVVDKINEHKTLEKTSANLLKQAQHVEHQMVEKEVEKESAENELARIHLDMLNTTNQLEMLKNRKREISEERKKKEDTVATYELEIRQGHDINEKKQTEVGKLNKLHDQIMNSSTDTSKGPIEAHKNHLLNEIKELTEKLQRLEKGWIKKQTAFVKHQQRLEEVGDETKEMKTKKAILEQKRARLQAIYEKHEKDIRDIKIGLKNLQTEMNKLNDGLSKNAGMETKLKSENFHVQSEIIEKLKELEKVNVKLEVDIDSLKEEKAQLLHNIIEAEKQILLWERKYQIEKEIQEALDPNIGQSEIKSLKQDLHRMELRLDEIRKRQEKTIYEMERQIYKRDTIELKYTKSDEEEEIRGSKELQPRITRQIENLRSALAQTTKNNKEYDKKLKQLQAAINERTKEINEVQTNTETVEDDLNDTMTELVQRKIERIKGVYDIVKSQTIYKAYDSIAAHRFKLDAPENILRERYEKQKDMNIQMIEVLRDVAESNPQYTEVMRSLLRI